MLLRSWLWVNIITNNRLVNMDECLHNHLLVHIYTSLLIISHISLHNQMNIILYICAVILCFSSNFFLFIFKQVFSHNICIFLQFALNFICVHRFWKCSEFLEWWRGTSIVIPWVEYNAVLRGDSYPFLQFQLPSYWASTIIHCVVCC